MDMDTQDRRFVRTYLLHVPVFEKRIEHVDLFQLALLVKRHLGRRRRLRGIG